MPRKKKQKCHYCDNEALYLCDFALECGFIPTDEQKDRIKENTMSTEEFTQMILDPKDIVYRTCDRPLCERHRQNRGHVFFCGKEGGVETRDFCPGHAHGPEGKPRYNPIGGAKAG